MPPGLKFLGTIDGIPEYVVTDARMRDRLFRHKDTAALYKKGAIYYRNKHVARLEHIRQHELEHVRQERILGGALFRLLYRLANRLVGYAHNPFEIYARRR